MCENLEFVLYPVPPYSFDISASIFSGGDPEIRIYNNGIFRQAFCRSGRHFILEIKSSGTAQNPELECKILTESPELDGGTDHVKKFISAIFNLDDNLIPFYDHVRDDPVLAGIIPHLYGLKPPTTPTVYEALVDSIIEQQISLSVAHRLQNRLIKLFGETISCGKTIQYCYPTPESLAKVDIPQFRATGLTNRKGEYIRDISAAVSTGEIDLEELRQESDTREIIRYLSSLRGIGRWTAELTVIRGMHRLDAFPADDVGFQRIISRFYCGGRKISADETRRIAGQWKEWQGLAGFYLEMAERRGIKL
jgi:DNA-3-methyladenine glycosylase II